MLAIIYIFLHYTYAQGNKKCLPLVRKGDGFVKRRLLGNPMWLALVMTGVLTWVQINAARTIDTAGTNRQWAVYASAAVLLVFFGLIALVTVLGPRGAALFWGETSLPLGFTGVVAGATLLMTVGRQAWEYLQAGKAPAPYYTVFNQADRMFLCGTLLFGVLGGLALLLFGFLWMFGKPVGSTAGQLLALFPIFWAACRLARYVMSYSSTIRNAFSSAQAAMLLLSLFFFYVFGQHLNGRLKWTGAELPSCAFAFGMIAVSAFAAQWVVQTYYPDRIAGVVVVPDVTDLLCGVFALAVGAVTCSKKATEKTFAYMEERDAAFVAALCDDDDQTVLRTDVSAPASEEPADTTDGVANDTAESATDEAENPAFPADEG